MTTENQSIPEKLSPCLSLALENPSLAKACRERLEAIPIDTLANGLVELFQGKWKLTAAQVAEMRIWPVPQLALLRATAILATRLVETSGRPIACRCTGRAGNPRSLSVTLSDPHFLDIEFVGPQLV